MESQNRINRRTMWCILEPKSCDMGKKNQICCRDCDLISTCKLACKCYNHQEDCNCYAAIPEEQTGLLSSTKYNDEFVSVLLTYTKVKGTVAAMARETGVSESSIRDYTTGNTPVPFEKAARIAKFLEIDLNDIINI